MLQQQIKEQIKDAMRSKDALRLNVLRGLSSAFTNELVAKMKMPSDTLPDEDALVVVKRLVKQRKDSIEQFRNAKREDLAKPEEDELAILVTYLPATMSREDIQKVALKKKTELGITDKAKAGQLTGAILKELKGQADGGDVKAVVDALFA